MFFFIYHRILFYLFNCFFFLSTFASVTIFCFSFFILSISYKFFRMFLLSFFLCTLNPFKLAFLLLSSLSWVKLTLVIFTCFHCAHCESAEKWHINWLSILDQFVQFTITADNLLFLITTSLVATVSGANNWNSD